MLDLIRALARAVAARGARRGAGLPCPAGFTGDGRATLLTRPRRPAACGGSAARSPAPMPRPICMPAGCRAAASRHCASTRSFATATACRPPVSGAGRRRHRQRQRHPRRTAHLARSVPARQGGRRDARKALGRIHGCAVRFGHPADGATLSSAKASRPCCRWSPPSRSSRSGCALRRQPRRVRAAARRRAPRHRAGQRSGRRARGRTPRPALRAGRRRRHVASPSATISTTTSSTWARRRSAPGSRRSSAAREGEESGVGSKATPERGESLWTPSSI